jgi:hypothetical protein
MAIIPFSSKTTSLAFIAAAALIAGCATEPPTIDTSPGAEMTFDGLYEVKNSRADRAWARPDVDISKYSKIMLQGADIEYRPGGEAGRSWSARSSGGPYEVTEGQKVRLRQVVGEAFREELAKSEHFEIVDEAGPDVLLIRGALLDVVSYVPPEPLGGRSSIYLSRVGEATLVIELRDSITETILARALDRRAAEAMGGAGFQESNRVSNEAEVRRLARSWARTLRERLDDYGTPAQ